MKTIIFVFGIFLSCAITAKAQTETGTFLIGGNIYYTSIDGNGVFTAQPAIGLFITDNLAVGSEFSFITAQGSNIWAIGPFVKPYFFVSPSGGYFAKGSFLAAGESGFDAHLGFSIGAGYASFINESIALEFGGSYSRLAESSEIIQLGVGFQIHFRDREERRRR